ncbi:MAG: flagellin [Xanthobacteraceae bacterium]|nr:flagellin [Xanthobacteraceae bacterium]
MSSNITLSAGVRQNLLSLQNTAALLSQTELRLATGKKVNSALDGPSTFFTAQGLSQNATDLSGLLDAVGNAVQTIEGADNGITAITDLLQAGKALTDQALQTPTTDSTTRADLATSFDDLLAQIDQLATDAGFNGVNLLDGNDLTVNFNADASSTITITGVDDSTAGALSVAGAVSAWAGDVDITAAQDDISAALTTLQTQSKTFGASLTVLQTRQDFMKSMINTLQVGADNLVLADTNEEGANLTALQTRQQLSIVALSLASQSNQAVLRLFQ